MQTYANLKQIFNTIYRTCFNFCRVRSWKVNEHVNVEKSNMPISKIRLMMFSNTFRGRSLLNSL